MRHDVTFPLYVEVDEIYNLACPASPIHYQHDPVQTTKTSVHGAINMLGLAKRVRAKILQASTWRSMAIPRSIRRARTIGATSIRSGRAPATTRASAAPRRCSSTTTASTSSKIKVARIFNTYGPRMHPNDGRVVSNFIVQALQGEPITIYGDGSQTRSFCYVDDLIEGLIRLMSHGRRGHRPGQSRQSGRSSASASSPRRSWSSPARARGWCSRLPGRRSGAAPAGHRLSPGNSWVGRPNGSRLIGGLSGQWTISDASCGQKVEQRTVQAPTCRSRVA